MKMLFVSKAQQKLGKKQLLNKRCKLFQKLQNMIKLAKSDSTSHYYYNVFISKWFFERKILFHFE